MTKLMNSLKLEPQTSFAPILRSLSTQKKASPDSNVPLRKLYNHFQQLHSAPNADNFCEKQDKIIKEFKDRETILSQFAELDQPFSEDEVKHSIKMLKNKKTGLDWP